MSRLWVFVESLAEAGRVTLSSEESRHVVSRRLRVGDELTVFDAAGRTGPARIESLTRKAIEVEVTSLERAPEPDSGFRLATAIPKGERLSTLLQMWTQLGLEVWQPLICQDSAVRKLDVDSPRLQRILVEGCKVARRPYPIRVLPPLDLAAALEQAVALPLYFGDRCGAPAGFERSEGCFFIGPEAGFSDAELALLIKARARATSLGEYNLRIETAAVAAMTAYHLSRQNRDHGSPERRHAE